jgi:cytochrome c-type biogenesis protein CcmE
MPGKAWIGAMIAVAGVALAVLAFSSIGDSLVYYWNPTELLAAGDQAHGATIRLGGQVEVGSVEFDNASTDLAFTVGDGITTVRVEGHGMPPQMFREGIGVIVEGTLREDGVFQSRELLIKHSNEYQAPEDGEQPDVKTLDASVERGQS